jgi:hypothetical protein
LQVGYCLKLQEIHCRQTPYNLSLYLIKECKEAKGECSQWIKYMISD